MLWGQRGRHLLNEGLPQRRVLLVRKLVSRQLQVFSPESAFLLEVGCPGRDKEDERRKELTRKYWKRLEECVLAMK